MRKILMTVIIVGAVVGVGVGIGWLASRGTVTPPPVAQTPPDTTAGNHASTASDDAQSMPVQTAPPHDAPIVAPPSSVQTDSIAQVATNLPGSTNWEDTIDAIVGSDDADTNKVKQLFALFPKLPPDGQEEAVQHLSNLVEDTNYAQLGALMTNDSLSEGVLDELLADLLNRPNSTKLPMLLDLAQDPNNAKSAEAKDLLELYLGEDYGDNPIAWQTNMNIWLTNNPD